MSQPSLPRRDHDGRATGTPRVGPAAPSGNAVSAPPAAGSAARRRRAVALSYDPDNDDAPVVTAMGQGLVADEIIRRAREAGVPVTEDPRLTSVLSQIDVGRVIPPELYAVVAEVLAYVYRLEDRVNRKR